MNPARCVWHCKPILMVYHLDEQHRYWAATLEANRPGWGGEMLLLQITGLDEKVIRRGKAAPAAPWIEQPTGLVRWPGGAIAGIPTGDEDHLRLGGIGHRRSANMRSRADRFR